MSAVYSAQIVAALVPGGSAAQVYTVPAGIVAVIRDMSLSNHSNSATGKWTVYVTVPNGAAAIASGADMAGYITTRWTGRAVLEPGDILNVNPGSQNMQVLISGYLLSAP